MLCKGPFSPVNLTGIPSIHLFQDRIQCGFPSPAEGYTDSEIDFSRYIMDHPASSYCFYVQGNSMEGLFITEGDLIVVDRSRPPGNNNIIVCSLDGSFTLKQYSIRKGHHYLVPAHPDYETIEITENREFLCWGVAVTLIRKLV